MSDIVRFDNMDFPVMKIPNSGEGNNCLGFALGNFLKCKPAELRESIRAMVVINASDADFLNNVCLSLFEGDEIDPENRYSKILSALNAGCFLPAELFIMWCMKSHAKKIYLLNCNVVFFIKRKDHYESVVSYLENVSLSTCYIGCNNFHYEQLLMQKKNSLLFDVAYFAKSESVSPGT